MRRPKVKMSSSIPDGSKPDSSASDGMRTAVLTVSDSCSRGERVDLSGPAVAEVLDRRKFQVVVRSMVTDERAAIQQKLAELCASARLVVTTGGTGIAPRDVTPEATIAVCGRLVEGIAEQMRLQGTRKTRFAALSRGVCGVHGTSLILNLPGNPARACCGSRDRRWSVELYAPLYRETGQCCSDMIDAAGSFPLR